MKKTRYSITVIVYFILFVYFSLSETETNFPRVFKAWFVEKAREIARQCVEPPKKPKPNAPPFVKKPSLQPAISFLVKHVKRYPEEICQICRKRAFPQVPIVTLHMY